jgi:hypothetical protein
MQAMVESMQDSVIRDQLLSPEQYHGWAVTAGNQYRSKGSARRNNPSGDATLLTESFGASPRKC